MSLSQDAHLLTLTVADDGRGMEHSTRDGLGTTLMESLAMDLAGDVRVVSDAEGTRVQVRFPREN